MSDRPADVTFYSVGVHQGKNTYIDASGARRAFQWKERGVFDTGRREYGSSGVCNTWTVINGGQPYCFPADRTVWTKGNQFAVYLKSGSEVYRYEKKPGNPEQLKP